MATRPGTLLERQVESIFSSAGFNTETNKYHSDYEIDVYAQMGDIDVVAECKQYENSNLSVRNLIHEWRGKNESIEADVVVLVIYGQEIKDEEKRLAEESEIQIWDENDIENLLTKDDEQLKEFIFETLPLKDEELGAAYKTDIRELVWKPYLEGKDNIDEDMAHEELLQMVKQRIRREMFQKGSEKEERRRHIKFFERVKKDGLIRSNIQVKSSHEKFQKLLDKLDKSASPFENAKSDRYLGYMNSVQREFEEAKEYYLEVSGRKQIERLLKARLKYLLKYGGEVALAPRKQSNPIKASRENSKVSLNFEIENPGDLETIRWILTKEGSYNQKEEENGQKRNLVSFRYEDIEDAVEAFIRILDEYKNWELDRVRLVDKNKDDLTRGQSLFTQLLGR